MDKLAEEIGMDAKELMYFLVCAKMPYYLSKVERSMKSSFVEAASSLYYLERNYLVSTVLKLFEVGDSERELFFSLSVRFLEVFYRILKYVS